MTLEDLIRDYRRLADDTSEPPHLSDEDLARHASEGEREACIRARLLFDDSTAEVTQYAVTANQPVIAIDPRIDIIRAARFQPAAGGRAREIDLTGLDWIQEQCDWQGRSSSRPSHAVHVTKTQLRLWPKPSVAGTLYLDVYRLPLYDIEGLGDEPEIDADHHESLVDWLLYRSFSTKDSEHFNSDAAAEAYARFEETFGERPDADTRRRHRERRRVTTRCL